MPSKERQILLYLNVAFKDIELKEVESRMVAVCLKKFNNDGETSYKWEMNKILEK